MLIILIITAAVLGIRLFVVKKEIKNISTQLNSYNNFSTGKKMDISLVDRDVETLGSEINTLIDHYVSAKREKISSENELKEGIASISHDLRTPLTSIKGYLQMVKSKDLSKSQREEYLNIALERSVHLEKLVNDFFELSKIESHDYTLRNERINMTEMTNEMVLSFYNGFKEKEVEPDINISSTPVFIMNDRAAVTRVLENLLSNALQYSKGGIGVTVRKNEDKVLLRVENSTEIIDEAHNPELFFDRFYIADKSRTGRSSGLGLAVTKSLMDKMNGRIRAEYDGERLAFTCEWQGAD
ncbi:sensor histidine kinase [Jeotgalicoccus coquinae]|nr:HAMP domain-containing sensor histidine kinase [Jeotgalicoccus coquinae]